MTPRGPSLSNASLYRLVLLPFCLFALIVTGVTLFLVVKEHRSKAHTATAHWNDLLQSQSRYFEDELFLKAYGAVAARAQLMADQFHREEPAATLCFQIEVLERVGDLSLVSRCVGPEPKKAKLTAESTTFNIPVGARTGAKLRYEIVLPPPWAEAFPLSLMISLIVAFFAAVASGAYLVSSLQGNIVQPLLRTIEGNARLAALAEVAEKVAHDIRSPLTVLNVVNADLPELPEKKRALVTAAIRRIQDIASSLLETQKSSEAAVPVVLSNTLKSIASEKRLQLAGRGTIVIEESSWGAPYSALVQPVELKRVLSNLVDNSIDALGSNGKITLTLAKKAQTITLSVSDNGRGIEPKVLPKLMEKGATFHKANGSGLGLYHARTTLQSWGGKIEIQSTVNVGTEVRLLLPAS